MKQVLQLRKEIREFNPDIIHIHLAILWFVCLAQLGMKNIGLFHTLHSDPRKTSYGKNVYVDRLCYNRFHVIPICLNNEMKNYADDLFRLNSTQVITNGICIDDYQTHSRQLARRALGINDGSLVIGHVGRFAKVKNHKKIINVFNEVYKRNPEAKLVLVGDGELQENIKKYCNTLGLYKSVVFCGAIDNVPFIMQAFDEFIFPSLYEGLGIVLIEAQAAGIYCIVSNNVPVEALVSEKICRMDLEESDTKWAEAMIERRVNFKSENNLMDYSIERVIFSLKELYKKAMKQRDERE
ncbi:glycosyltransferase [Oribacterium sp. NK2B42]|uniref:glycosyltransferase n=1 Tax=Oribacterium sp. NK2B42 TaxID=689781 RepID=UPI0012EB228C|nr:glycosyltransferase [Oribacterium sp. NK2B42]